VTHGGFELMTKPMETNAVAVINDDASPLDRGETIASAAWTSKTLVPAVVQASLSQPGLKTWLALVPPNSILSPHVRRVAFAWDDPSDSGLVLMAVERLDEELHLDGVDEFQAQLGLRLLNLSIVRHHFDI